MRRKRLKHYTDVFCEMFTGWRCPDEDLAIMRVLGDGKLYLDFLERTFFFDDIKQDIHLFILEEIAAWLEKNLDKDGIQREKILEASLTIYSVPVEKSVNPKSRTKKILQINVWMLACIRTDETEYRTKKQSTQEYHYVG